MNNSIENKYFSPAKAQEYMRMSWPQWPENKASEPFYAFLTEKIRHISTLVQSVEPFCLEFGFGAGRILFEITKSFPSAQITGVETSPSMIKVSRSLLHGVNLHLIQGSVENASAEDNTVDLTICINVLDRIKNTTLAIQELVRITNKGGFLLVASAFDYEFPFTPIKEHILPQRMLDLFVERGCTIIEDSHTELAKILPNREVKKYNERVFILRKDN